MTRTRLLAAVVLSGAAVCVTGQAQTPTPPAAPAEQAFGFSRGAGPATLNGQIESIERLPGGAFSAVKLSNREGLYFLSANGRWVLRGTVYDLWQGQELTTLADLRSAAQTINLSGLGVVWDDLKPTLLGEGPQETIVFIDPHCPYCAQLLEQMQALVAANPRSHRFVIVLVPMLGERSAKTIRNLGCAIDQEAARAALLAHRFTTDLAEAATCDLGPMQKRFVLARLLGLDAVPFLIRADGRPQAGLPPDLALWLAQAGPAPMAARRAAPTP